MKTTESLPAAIGRILDENLQLDMPRPVKAKMKVVREIIELIKSHNVKQPEKGITTHGFKDLDQQRDDVKDKLGQELIIDNSNLNKWVIDRISVKQVNPDNDPRDDYYNRPKLFER